MKRQIKVVLTVVTLLAVIAPAMAQQASRPRTLAERLSSLRFGWGSTEPKPKAEPAKAQPTAKPSNPPRVTSSRTAPPPRVANRSTSRGQSLPRVNPRNLLPRDFQGPNLPVAKTERPVDSKPSTVVSDTAPKSTLPSVESLGTVRSRILRDLRRQRNEGVAEAAPITARPINTSRAGSVLSAKKNVSLPSDSGQLRDRISTDPLSSDFLRQATKTPATAKRAAEEKKAAISKSIAAEVAEHMAAQSSEPVSKPESLPAAPVEEEAVAQQAVESTTPQTVVAAPVEQAENKINDETVAETATKVVAADPFDEPVTAGADETTLPAAAPVKVASLPAVTPLAPPAAPAVAEVATPEVTTNGTAKGPVAIGPTRISLDVEPKAVSTELPATPTINLTPSASVSAAESAFGKPVANATATPAASNNSAAEIGRDDILITQSTPQVTARVLGPRRVVIGRPARFQVHLSNRGAAAANEFTARVMAPAWAEVASITADEGVIDQTTVSSQPVLWKMDRFAAGDSATMEMTLIAREARPIELGVDWSHAPVSSHAFVEVQEPKLQMRISGPDEVLYGKPQLFRLTLSNPGTGVAEDVSLLLTPPGKPIEKATRHALGDLRPGASKSVEIELTAREAGQLALAARANAEGGVMASVDKEVFCRKPEIEIDWRGPAKKYTNALATYYFRVRNSGTAAAEGVTFDVTLPEGFEMTSASEGQSYDSRRRLLRWRVGSLRPGDDYYMELKGIARTDGEKQLAASAQTGDQLIRDELTAVTNVIAVADLKLDVRDPKGPLPVGTDAVYEVRVTNRGSNIAENVDVIALFSGGIEPQSVEGRQCRISDGRVALPTIDRLPAGGEVVLRIHAKAVEPGTHIFRAEVACTDLEIRLAAEEMTRFYADDTGPIGASARAADRFNRRR